MSRRRTPGTEERLAELAGVTAAPDPGTAAERLRRALADRSAPVVARAARLTAQLGRSDLAGELEAAFHRILDDPRASDPGCTAKTALAAALVDLGSPAVEVLRRGIGHVQLEPVYGGRVDVAAGLRAHCAVGLAATEVPDLMLLLADLLADPEPAARSGAVRAVAACGRPEGPPLLRFKARLGDADPAVLGDAFAALVAVDPDGSLEVVADALEDEDDAVAEAAALALGGCRLEAAFRALRDAAGRLVHGGRRRTLLTALALLRRDDAFEHLLGLVESGPTGVAVDAVHALGISRHDDHLRRRVEAAVADRGDARVEDALRASFGG